MGAGRVSMTTAAVVDTAAHLRRQAAEAAADAARYEAKGDEFWPLAMHQRGVAAAYENAARLLDPYAAPEGTISGGNQ